MSPFVECSFRMEFRAFLIYKVVNDAEAFGRRLLVDVDNLNGNRKRITQFGMVFLMRRDKSFNDSDFDFCFCFFVAGSYWINDRLFGRVSKKLNLRRINIYRRN